MCLPVRCCTAAKLAAVAARPCRCVCTLRALLALGAPLLAGPRGCVPLLKARLVAGPVRALGWVCRE